MNIPHRHGGDTYEGYSPASDAAEPRSRDRAWMVSTIVSRAATYPIRKVCERRDLPRTTSDTYIFVYWITDKYFLFIVIATFL